MRLYYGTWDWKLLAHILSGNLSCVFWFLFFVFLFFAFLPFSRFRCVDIRWNPCNSGDLEVQKGDKTHHLMYASCWGSWTDLFFRQSFKERTLLVNFGHVQKLRCFDMHIGSQNAVHSRVSWIWIFWLLNSTFMDQLLSSDFKKVRSTFPH